MKRITIPINEYDIELFEQLVSGGDTFSWNFDGVDVTFVKEENVERVIESNDWWQQVREHWGNPETLEDYERILHEMQHREQVVGVGRKDIMERHAIEDMIEQMRGEEE